MEGPDSFRTEVVTTRTTRVIRGLTLSASRPPGRGGGLEIVFHGVANGLGNHFMTPR